MPNNNMRIWDAVSKTDPKYTKTVNQRGGFTAIAAQSQIMAATAQFGPIGIGWGYDTGAPIIQEGLVIIPVTLWHGTREQKFGPIYGCAELKFGSKPDHDAPKKATTDAITKGLSQLGFNADVFLGLYDDNKYVECVKGEFQNPGSPELAKLIEAAIGSAKDLDALQAAWLTNMTKENRATLNKAQFDNLTASKDKRKAELEAAQSAQKQAAE